MGTALTELSEAKEKIIDSHRKIRNLRDSHEEKIRDINLIHRAECAGTEDAYEMKIRENKTMHEKKINELKYRILELEKNKK